MSSRKPKVQNQDSLFDSNVNQEESRKIKKQQQCPQEIKKSKSSPKQKNTNNQKMNSGHWTTSENARYIIFISYHKNMFEQNSRRKVWRIFKEMSNFISTRNYIQCRSHHQKMLEQYETIQKYVQLKSSSYSQKNLQKIKNQLIEMKTKSKYKNSDDANKAQSHEPSELGERRAINNASSFINHKFGCMNYLYYHPWFSSQIPYSYPFFWN